MYYEAENTVTYWYGNGRYIGQAASIIAETEIESIKDLLEHNINDKIEIVVYTDITDLKQTNIGQEEAETTWPSPVDYFYLYIISSVFFGHLIASWSLL